MNDECGGDLACEMSIRFGTKGTWYEYETRPQTHRGGDDQRYGFKMWGVWGIDLMDEYEVVNMFSIFS